MKSTNFLLSSSASLISQPQAFLPAILPSTPPQKLYLVVSSNSVKGFFAFAPPEYPASVVGAALTTRADLLICKFSSSSLLSLPFGSNAK